MREARVFAALAIKGRPECFVIASGAKQSSSTSGPGSPRHLGRVAITVVRWGCLQTRKRPGLGPNRFPPPL